MAERPPRQLQSTNESGQYLASRFLLQRAIEAYLEAVEGAELPVATSRPTDAAFAPSDDEDDSDFVPSDDEQPSRPPAAAQPPPPKRAAMSVRGRKHRWRGSVNFYAHETALLCPWLIWPGHSRQEQPVGANRPSQATSLEGVSNAILPPQCCVPRPMPGAA